MIYETGYCEITPPRWFCKVVLLLGQSSWNLLSLWHEGPHIIRTSVNHLSSMWAFTQACNWHHELVLDHWMVGCTPSDRKRTCFNNQDSSDSFRGKGPLFHRRCALWCPCLPRTAAPDLARAPGTPARCGSAPRTRRCRWPSCSHAPSARRRGRTRR